MSSLLLGRGLGDRPKKVVARARGFIITALYISITTYGRMVLQDQNITVLLYLGVER